MKKIWSFLVTLFVCFIIIASILLSLDVIGIIKLPEKISLKSYLSKTSIQASSQEVFYPDYEATGLSAENKITQDTYEEKKTLIVETKGEELNEAGLKELQQSMNNTEEQIITPNYNVTDNSFFYTQLDNYGKTFYSRLYANLDNLKTGSYVVDFGTTFNELLQEKNGEAVLTNAFQLSINALLLDHPEIFYLDVTKMYMFTESTTSFSGTTYRISIGPDGNTNYLLNGFNGREDIYVAEDKVKTELYNITSNLSGNDYEKILKVHNYLIDTITYDSTTEDKEVSHTLYGALVNKEAVCDGYAKAFKYILDNIGISCVEICGTAQNSAGVTESHAWNDVLVEGKWYAIDVTWDDPIIIGGNGQLTNDLRYSYFLKGRDNFYNSHQEDGFIVSNGEFYYPAISAVGYF